MSRTFGITRFYKSIGYAPHEKRHQSIASLMSNNPAWYMKSYMDEDIRSKFNESFSAVSSTYDNSVSNNFSSTGSLDQ